MTWAEPPARRAVQTPSTSENHVMRAPVPLQREQLLALVVSEHETSTAVDPPTGTTGSRVPGARIRSTYQTYQTYATYEM